MKYDYIIAGSGCAGLSLLFRILNEEKLQKSTILVVDQVNKNENDRTWCYWESGEGMFESIVYKKWDTLTFETENFTNQFKMQSYEYKMIRGIEFYEHIISFAKRFSNVHFIQEEILSFSTKNGSAQMNTASKTYESEYIFNSTNLLYPKMTTENSLLQHFMGWEIETDQPFFDERKATFMDFTLGQENGATFMYVLPTSEKQALIEYTLFGPALIEDEIYENQLRLYIKNKLGIDRFNLIATEKGVIPMSLVKFDRHFENSIINIGTAGGYTKPSSGYTFYFVQKHCEQIVIQLLNNQSPLVKTTFRDKMFHWYDRTLLEVMLSERMDGKAIFSTLFKKVAPEKLLQFLANESAFWQEVKIMSSVPITKFLPAGIKQMFKR